MFWRLFLSMLLATLFVGNVTAQVQITGVDRSFQNGSIVTIDGSGFGTKGNPTPYLWDDLSSSAYEGYGDGDVFPTRQGSYGHPMDPNAPQNRADYIETSRPTVLETNTVRIPGKPVYSIKDQQGSALLNVGDVGGDFLVVDWWIYGTDIMAGHTREIKLGRFWAGASGVAGRVTLYPDHLFHETLTGTVADWGSWMTDGVWNHYRITMDSSGGLATGNGVLKFYWNNQLMVSVDDLSFDKSVSSGPNFTWVEMIGAVDYNQFDPNIGPTYISDVYLDNTPAMVVLGDSSTWSNVRHYELQIPQDWDPDFIQVLANLGSFTPTESVWLYVMDSNGNVNSNGLAVDKDHDDPPPAEYPGKPGTPLPEGS